MKKTLSVRATIIRLIFVLIVSFGILIFSFSVELEEGDLVLSIIRLIFVFFAVISANGLYSKYSQYKISLNRKLKNN